MVKIGLFINIIQRSFRLTTLIPSLVETSTTSSRTRRGLHYLRRAAEPVDIYKLERSPQSPLCRTAEHIEVSVIYMSIGTRRHRQPWRPLRRAAEPVEASTIHDEQRNPWIQTTLEPSTSALQTIGRTNPEPSMIKHKEVSTIYVSSRTHKHRRPWSPP